MSSASSVNASNITAFLSGATTALMAPVQYGGALPTPMVAVIYKGYRISQPPAAVDVADTTSEERRLTITRVAVFNMLALVMATTVDLTQATVITSTTWSAWVCLLITLGHLTLNPPVQDADLLRGIVDIPVTIADALYRGLRSLRGSTPPDFTAYSAILIRAANDLGLPSVGSPTSDMLAAMASSGAPEEMAAAYALAVYLIGRPYAGSIVSVSTKRTANLENKGNLKRQWPSISGSLKMSVGTIKMISLSWERDPKLRAGAFIPLIGLNLGAPDANLAMIGTMVGLLPMSQMGHVKIIMDFVKRFPFIVNMSSISAELYELADGVVIWNSYPARIRPFCKLLYRDQFKAMDSKRLNRLLRLASDKLAADQPSLMGYAVRGADQLLVDEFEALQARYQPVSLPGTTGNTTQPAGPPVV